MWNNELISQVFSSGSNTDAAAAAPNAAISDAGTSGYIQRARILKKVQKIRKILKQVGINSLKMQIFYIDQNFKLKHHKKFVLKISKEKSGQKLYLLKFIHPFQILKIGVKNLKRELEIAIIFSTFLFDPGYV